MDPDILPIQIRTQEKKVRSGTGHKNPDPKQPRIRNLDPDFQF